MVLKVRSALILIIIALSISQVPYQTIAKEVWRNANLPDLPMLHWEYAACYGGWSYLPNGTTIVNPGPLDASIIYNVYLFDLDQTGVTDDLVCSQLHGCSVIINGTHVLFREDYSTPFPVFIGDFDRDGVVDDFSGRSALGFYNESGVFCDFSLKLNKTPNYTNYVKVCRCLNRDFYSRTPIGIGDFNRDGYADDLVIYIQDWVSTRGSLMAYQRGRRYTPYWEFDPNVTYSESQVYPLSYALNDLEIGDFDADGWHDDVVVAFRFNKSYVINGEGHVLWDFATVGMVHAVRLADLDNDGVKDDILLAGADSHLWAFNRMGGLLWSWSSIGPLTALAVGELDGLGGDDIVVGGENGGVVAFDSTGNVLWVQNYTRPIRSLVMAPQLYLPSTIDDVLVTEVTQDASQLHCLNASGGEQWNLSGAYSAVVGDLDGDGQADDFVTFTRGNLYSYIIKPLNFSAWLSEDDIHLEKIVQSSTGNAFHFQSPDRLYFDLHWTMPDGITYTPRARVSNYQYNTTTRLWSTSLHVGMYGPVGTHEVALDLYYAGRHIARYTASLSVTLYIPIAIIAMVCIAITLVIAWRLRRRRSIL